MDFFKYFPDINYSNNLTAKNIICRMRMKETVIANASLFYDYTITDAITRPDLLSLKFYGSSNYTWIILYSNNILNPLWQWPKTNYQFNAFIKDKYGSIRGVKSLLNKPHHYMLDNKFIIDENAYKNGGYEKDRLKVVSYYDYEYELNEKNRKIKMIDSDYISQIERELFTIFK